MRTPVNLNTALAIAGAIGATPISIYSSSAPDQIAYLVSHSKARFAIVEHEHYLTEMLSVRGELPTLEQIGRASCRERV